MSEEPVYVQPIGLAQPIEPAVSLALRRARRALRHAEQQCRYHDQNWDFLGREYGDPIGPPRCDSCKQPWRVVTAIASIDRVLGNSDE